MKNLKPKILNTFKHINKTNGFIVPVLFFIFQLLKRISFFPLFISINRKIFGDKFVSKNYLLPELWVVINLTLSLVGKYTIICTNNKVFAYIFLFTASLRIFAMLVYQINVLFFDRYAQWFLYPQTKKKKDNYVIQSGTRIIILLLINMIEYVVHFSVIFVALNCISGNAVGNITIADSLKLFFNMHELSTFANSNILFFAYSEVGIGMFMNILCIARMLNLLPNAKTVESFCFYIL
jgi:hypothetical protein